MNSIAAPSPSPKQWPWAVALAALILLAYLPALHAGFIWDDDRYIVQNPHLRTIGGLWRIFSDFRSEPQYYPLTHASFWIEYHLWAVHPLGYHIDNILLHVAGAILLWRVLGQLQIQGAWAVAAIFAIHPIQVESVAWATERKNVLSGVFFFWALAEYLKFDFAEHPARCGKSCYVASLFLFLCALLSKSVASCLPAVILVLIWWKRGRIQRRDVTPLIPFFVLGAAMGTLTGWMERHVVGAMGPEFDFTSAQRFVIAGRAIWFYAAKLICPANLAFIYPRWNLDISGRPWLVLFPMVVATAAIALFILRRTLGRGPLAAVLLFVGTLFPALGFVNVYPMRYSFVADHFQYLSGIALIALAVSALQRTKGARLLIAIVLPVLVILTRRQCAIYRDPGTLWQDTLAKNPGSYMAHSNYADFLVGSDEPRAVAEYQEAIRLKHDDRSSLDALGLIYLKRKEYPDAIRCFRQAVDAVPDSMPAAFWRLRSEPYFDLGIAYGEMGDVSQSEKCYRKAIEYQPQNSAALENLGALLNDRGRRAEAIAMFREAIRISPGSIHAHTHLGDALMAEGDTAGAAAEYQIVIQLANPSRGK